MSTELNIKNRKVETTQNQAKKGLSVLKFTALVSLTPVCSLQSFFGEILCSCFVLRMGEGAYN